MPLQDKTAEKMLNSVTEFMAATLAKPDHRAWDHLLIYCPREVIERLIEEPKMTKVLSEKPLGFCAYIEGETVGQFLIRNGIRGPLLSALAVRIAPLAPTLSAAVKTPLASPEAIKTADELHKRRLKLATDVDAALSHVPSSPDGLELAMADMLFLGPEIADALRGKPFDGPTVPNGER